MESCLPLDRAQKRGAGEEGDASPAKRLMSSGSPEDELVFCDRCREIQWEDLAEIPPASRIGRKAADLGLVDRNALSRSPCPVCRLLAEATPQRLHDQHCRLAALSSSLAILGRRVGWFERVDYSDCTVLFPVPEAKFADTTAGQRIKRDWYEGGCLALVNNSGNENQIPVTGPRRIPPTVDFGLVKRWLQDCETHHRITCKFNVGGSGEVEGLRVIDCYTRRCVEAPATCRYVALSYVWGKPLTPNLDEERRNPTGAGTILPRVVVDAIDVTVALGERYLWVDQMCIDQNDYDMKANQIAQMDKIYAHAYLTLVAAAGQDSSHGLPGVGDKERRPQGHVNVAGGVDMIQIFPHTSSELDGSTWARRGWTYQEGYMSHRRLIFTDRQVSYLCNTAHQAETIQKPKRLSPAELLRSKTGFLDIIPTNAAGYGLGHSDFGRGNVWDDLKRKHLANYTRRQLTDEDDSLNAITGLFRALQFSGIRHVHGIPLRRNVRNEGGRCLEFPLAWHHETEGARRRHQFPSWSWSGWQGGIRMDESDICVPDECEIGLVERDGRVVSLPDWYKKAIRRPHVSSENTPRLLRVTAPVVHVQCVRKTWLELNKNLSRMSRLAGMSFTGGVHAVLPIREGVTQMAFAYVDEDVSLDDGVLGLVLRLPWSSRKNAILLLEQDAQQKQHYRRVGLVRVSGFAKTRPAAVGDSDPQTIYVDDGGLPLEEVVHNDEPPIWLREAVERTITIS